ncbi:bifunctional UDP-N-acetylglucosamine diphosphorylase/glucosamine-1-phosphate N-acetyltransferase GlmU [Sorangium sp. So ce1153]|uniref:bifunctional UDP-N-acetylglucosamine diphosphorylase/glucosamine-1-phosphate N-acetyltransferase GlmU n=1 Tax=Sorangium sp. So ce1153 TaxID=3133333 RepID=UPI003F63AB13
MKSARPKVLHELCGRPMLHYVVDAALAAGASDVVVVVGHGRDEVSAALDKAFSAHGKSVRTALQPEQRGTGDAVRCAMPQLKPSTEAVLILCGDTPLLDPGQLTQLLDALAGAGDAPMALLTAQVTDPTGYGRMLRDGSGRVIGIREHKDASPEERAITEVNPGVYLARSAFLERALAGLTTDNAQGELYLTDIVAQAAKVGGAAAVVARDAGSLVGINDRAQLAAAEEVLYGRIADRLRKGGVTIRTSARVDAGVVVEADAVIEHAVVLRGQTRVGAGARIDVGSVLTDVVVEAGASVKPYTVASQSSIGAGAQIGPFSHLRPDSQIEADAHIGNFVETKKTVVRKGAKANHLAYLGDGDIGEGANVGAGTIFCNYDGFRKHRTEIGPGAFIGSDSQIVAPVKIGAGAYVATGTTVTRDVPEDALAIGRVKQENKEGYAAKLKARLKDAAKK